MKRDKYDLDDLLYEQSYDCLTEQDFYPPSDDRTWKSYVKDINGGDNFAEYCEYIFSLFEENDYYE